VNIKANVLQWDNPDITQIVFDGQYMLGVSAGALEFSKELRNAQSEDNVLQVVTDYPQGWKVSKIVDGSDITVTWLSLSNTQGSQGAPVSTQLTMTANTGSTRTAYIQLEAGRLTYVITVVQTDQTYVLPGEAPGLISITDTDENPISVLTFAAAAGAMPAAKAININWPAGAKLYYTTVNAANPFTFSIANPNSNPTTGTVLEANTPRPKTYSIQPSQAISTTNLTTDPWFARVSYITYTAVDEQNIELARKTLTIRQEVYNLVTVPADLAYTLNGSTYTFSIRSNTGWRITSVIDPDYLLTPQGSDNLKIGTTGGFNTADGTELKFSVINDISKSGSVTVKFLCTDNSMPNAEKSVNINLNGIILTLTNDTGDMISELVFADVPDHTPAAQSFLLRKTNEVNVPYSSTNNGTAFPFSTSSGNLNPTLGTALPSGVESRAYTIAPSASMPALTFQDNFAEKQTKITYQAAGKPSMTFRQYAYQVVPDITTVRQDGYLHELRIRSNVDWFAEFYASEQLISD
jgi:hypothetical protein